MHQNRLIKISDVIRVQCKNYKKMSKIFCLVSCYPAPKWFGLLLVFIALWEFRKLKDTTFLVNEISVPCNDIISWYWKDQGSFQVLTLIIISDAAVGQLKKWQFWQVSWKKCKGGRIWSHTLIKWLFFIIYNCWLHWHHCIFAQGREHENYAIFMEWF